MCVGMHTSGVLDKGATLISNISVRINKCTRLNQEVFQLNAIISDTCSTVVSYVSVDVCANEDLRRDSHVIVEHNRDIFHN